MTYAKSREAILSYFQANEFHVKAGLVVPQVRIGDHTLFFKSRAVYLNSHSLHVDIREVSPEQFLLIVEETIRHRYNY